MENVSTHNPAAKIYDNTEESNCGFWPICCDYKTENEIIIGFEYSCMAAKCIHANKTESFSLANQNNTGATVHRHFTIAITICNEMGTEKQR